MVKNPVFIETFKQLGVEFHPSQILIGLLEDFVCHLYQRNVSNVNDARYNMFKLGKCTEESLPPNFDSLQQHILRCNYESFIRRRCLVAIIDAGSPEGHGWQISNDGLAIIWMTIPPAPDSVLEFIHCNCNTGCGTKRSCSCVKAGLDCTELCKCSSDCDSCFNSSSHNQDVFTDEGVTVELSDEELSETGD